jgi:hypothetical protein
MDYVTTDWYTSEIIAQKSLYTAFVDQNFVLSRVLAGRRIQL